MCEEKYADAGCSGVCHDMEAFPLRADTCCDVGDASVIATVPLLVQVRQRLSSGVLRQRPGAWTLLHLLSGPQAARCCLTSAWPICQAMSLGQGIVIALSS